MKHVAGLDLSLSGTGVIILNSENKVVVEKLIKSKPTNSPTAELKRLMDIREAILKALFETEYRLDLAVIEGLAFMAHNTTALTQLAGLNYMVREMLMNLNIPFIIVAPTTLKKFITGKGNTHKNEIMLATYKKWEVTLLNDNLCDAYGLAKIGLAVLNKTLSLNKAELEVVRLLETQWTSQK